MKQFQILYRNASGKTALTRTIVARDADEAVRFTTQFVRDNKIRVFEVPEDHIL